MNNGFNLKLTRGIAKVRNMLITNDRFYNLAKLGVFFISLVAGVIFFSPHVIRLSFSLGSHFTRIPANIGMPADAIEMIFAAFCVLQFLIYLVKQFSVNLIHSLMNERKRMGVLDHWQQLVFLLLSIAVIGYFFLMGVGFSRIPMFLEDPLSVIGKIDIMMSKTETVVYYACNVSLFAYVALQMHLIILKKGFRKIDAWRDSSEIKDPDQLSLF